jgi:predicted MFS family arabinose efflux permease
MTLDKRDKAMAILYMVNFVGNSGYAISLPFFPPMAVDKGISESTVGYVYSLYPVGAFIVSACLGSNLTLANSKNVLVN